MTVVPTQGEMPSLENVVLPSRALLRSWRHQTIPVREAGLDDAVGLYEGVVDSEDPGLRDMAILGVIADAMQPLEDLAYLGTAWDAPFTGLATYVRATTYSDRIPTNFWQEVARWDDARLDVLAGFAMREPTTKLIRGVLDLVGFTRRRVRAGSCSHRDRPALLARDHVYRHAVRRWLPGVDRDHMGRRRRHRRSLRAAVRSAGDTANLRRRARAAGPIRPRADGPQPAGRKRIGEARKVRGTPATQRSP